MQTALKKRHVPPSKDRKPKTVGGLVKFLPPSYTDRVSSSKNAHRGIISHIADQPVVVVSGVDEDGRVQVLQFVSISKNKLKRLTQINRPFPARLVPVQPSEPHPDTGGVVLRAGPGTRKRLPPNPHVDIGESRLVPLAALRDYNGARNGREKLSLAPESYAKLADMRASWEAAESARGLRLDIVCCVALLVALVVCPALLGLSYLGIKK